MKTSYGRIAPATCSIATGLACHVLGQNLPVGSGEGLPHRPSRIKIFQS